MGRKSRVVRPPGCLKGPGKKFWDKVLSEYEITEAHDLERLFYGCTCINEISMAEKIVSTEGAFIKDRFDQVREHPGMKTIRDNKLLFVKIIRELGLDLERPQESRPLRQY